MAHIYCHKDISYLHVWQLTVFMAVLIHAHSPQANGRIERLFGALQDRLVKEMRLKGIKTKEEANVFLGEYLPVYNQRFRVTPANKADIHVKPRRYFNLDRSFCIRTNRTVRNDNTIAHNGKLYQLKEKVMSWKVVVEERLNGSLYIISSSSGVSLKYREISERPQKRLRLQGSGNTKSPQSRPSIIHGGGVTLMRSQNLKSII